MESNMLRDYLSKARRDNPGFIEVGKECAELITVCLNRIKAITSLNTNEIEDVTVSLFRPLEQIYLDIIRLNNLVDQLGRITKSEPKTLALFKGHISHCLNWVEELGVEQRKLTKKNPPFETVQLATLRIKAGVKLYVNNYEEVRTALSKIVDQCEKGTQPIPAHFIQYILAFKRRDIAELERSCPKDIPTQLIFYIALRARVNSVLSKQWLEADHGSGNDAISTAG